MGIAISDNRVLKRGAGTKCATRLILGSSMVIGAVTTLGVVAESSASAAGTSATPITIAVHHIGDGRGSIRRWDLSWCIQGPDRSPEC